MTDYADVNFQLEQRFTHISSNKAEDPAKGVARIIESATHTGYG